MITAAGGVAVYAYLYTEPAPGGWSDPRFPQFVVTEFEQLHRALLRTTSASPRRRPRSAPRPALSTFVSFAAFLLILFLKPPSRFFASWTRPDGDRRPAVLVAVLCRRVQHRPVRLLVHRLLRAHRRRGPVFRTVLPALVLWFAALTAAYRYRLLDRALGLQELAAVGAPRG